MEISRVSILRQLIFYITLTIATITLVVTLSFGIVRFNSEVAQRRTNMIVVFNTLSKLLERAIAQGDFALTEDYLNSPDLPNFISSIKVIAGSDRVVAQRNNSLNDTCTSSEVLDVSLFQGESMPHIGVDPFLLRGKITFCDLKDSAFSLAFYLLNGGILLNILLYFVTKRVILLSIRPLSEVVNASTSTGVFSQSLMEKSPIEIKPLLESILELQHNISETKSQAMLGKMASQVSHDIRSPLAALEMILPSTHELPEDKRLIIRNAINRIRDIANSLLKVGRDSTNTPLISQLPATPSVHEPTQAPDVHYLSPLIDSVISEKRIQYRDKLNISIHFNHSNESYALFANIVPTEFKRMISNLVNNSIEAMQNESGKVNLSLTAKNPETLCLTISDNGSGIAKEILPKITQKGATFGKREGNGLGLYHAKETLLQWGGTLEIVTESRAARVRGTTLSLLIPAAPPPDWFVPTLKISPGMKIAIFDDDQTIHQIWAGRFESILKKVKSITLEHLSSSQALRKFYGLNFTELDDVVFLVDYEMIGQSETGLDLIEELGIQQQSLLVTSRYEEDHIQERCKRLGIKLIPKPMSAFVPILVRDV